jgi:hypothetical protein
MKVDLSNCQISSITQIFFFISLFQFSRSLHNQNYDMRFTHQLALAASASAACTRHGLMGIHNRLVEQSIQLPRTMEPLPFTDLASNTKITQNNIALNFVDQTALGNITSLHSGYNITAVDTETCQVAMLMLPVEASRKDPSAKHTAVFSMRIKTDDNMKITEIEALNALPGAHALFAPEKYPETSNPVWFTPASTTEKKYTREDILTGGEAYINALQNGKSNDPRIAKDCPRMENGVQTTTSCGGQMGMFAWPVTNRRWVVDDVTGVAVGLFWFNYKDGKGTMNQLGLRGKEKTSLWLHEYFKVLDGKVVRIEAAMQTMTADFKDAWAAEYPEKSPKK